jgi:ribosomal protein S12
VLNETAILSFIENEHSKLSEDDIVHISGILEAHILMKQQALCG